MAAIVRFSSLSTTFNCVQQSQFVCKNNSKKLLSVAAGSCSSSHFIVSSLFGVNHRKQSLQFKTKSYGSLRELPASCKITGMPSVASPYRESKPGFFLGSQILTNRGITTSNVSQNPENASPTPAEVTPRIKFKRLDKTARHIMQILDREAVEEVRTQREIPDIRPGYIIQLRLEVPENKRRVSTVKGIVIARRNAGLNTTIRLRRMVAGVGIESLLPLYSPNVKEIQILDKKKVRRAKLYYLRDKMNALKK